VLGGTHGLSAAQQLRIPTFLASHSDLISRVIERTTSSAASVAASAVWLFAIAVLAIFLLKDGRQMMDAAAFERIIRQIDTMLGKYIRAQLTLAGLKSFGLNISRLLNYPL